jgi:hypothetical protein
MKKIFTATIDWISREEGGRVVIPLKGTRYCPIIKFDASNEKLWSIDFICPDFCETNIIQFSFLVGNAPENRITINNYYDLFEGDKKVATVKIKSVI